MTPRRVLAKQKPQNLWLNHQSILGRSIVNEFKVGYNRPETSAVAFGPSGYDPVGVSLSGTVTSSVDRRARHDRHRAQRSADSRDQRLDDGWLDLRAALALDQ